MPHRTAPARRAAVLLAALLAGCIVSPQPPDVDQLARMRAEPAQARAAESIGCIARDRVCAQMIQLRGMACADLADARGTPAADRPGLRRCALADARRLPGLIPSDAPPTEQEADASTIFQAWRGALDADDTAATPDAVRAAAAGLRTLPLGSPYAATLDAALLLHTALSVGGPQSCTLLAQASADLPDAPSPTLAPRVARERMTISAQQSNLHCS